MLFRSNYSYQSIGRILDRVNDIETHGYDKRPTGATIARSLMYRIEDMSDHVYGYFDPRKTTEDELLALAQRYAIARDETMYIYRGRTRIRSVYRDDRLNFGKQNVGVVHSVGSGKNEFYIVGQNNTILLKVRSETKDAALQWMRNNHYPMLVAAIEQGDKIILATTTDVFSLLRPLGISHFKELRKGKKGTKTFVKDDNDYPYDYFCFMASLPLLFKTTTKKIPSASGYLKTDPEKVQKWGEILGPKTKPRIGIVWSGGEEFLTDWRRSMTVEQFVTGLPKEFEYVCLQKTVRKVDETTILDYPWIKFIGNQLDDFADTAAVMDNVDLVISTCTSTANLAGALGKESWVLLPFSPDWRWDAEWYSSVKQYRQKTAYNTRDWSEILAQVKADLQAKYMHESS